ncbi:TetR/AcrR family transcriptional regulator [Liquorilactobacillus satsumensis]|uniref:TetR/AcrR family transcriptional regulator n=1 Tax=Liquorilactobacillus satsumensis TaxID=259059 RepID=UPI0039E916ED
MQNTLKRDTKELILKVALKLFSEKGYDGVGIRDISKKIGIRESAIYKHYKSKQDIFDSILKDIDKRYTAKFSGIIPSKNMNNIGTEKSDERKELFRIITNMFKFYLDNEYGSQLRRMLTMEQFRNSEASSVFREMIIDRGLEYISSILARLINDGVYIDANPKIMAIQLYAPVYLLLSKYDNQNEKYDEALIFLKKHIIQFDKMYLKKE